MSNFQFYSLSGHLTLKHRITFLQISVEKKLWFVYNESLFQLESYLSEKSFLLKNNHLHCINLLRSAIIPSQDEQNVFIILTDNQKYELRAENYESYLVWVRELQKKRSNFQKECNEVFYMDAFNEEDDTTIFHDDSEDALSTSSNIKNSEKLKHSSRIKVASVESIDSAFSDFKMASSVSCDSSRYSLEKEIIELALCKDKESEYQKILSQKDEIIDDLRNLILESNQIIDI
ncbi:TBC1 domain family member 2B-like [Brachionus plicatilis]|uniref:TBC1 domain family member 2B-like n=1 Tax=Brachionus plicatilis TaxID=10195 RepID=A0A3M7TAA2_BRAPC|nr:TBC1 domain family member 2B-like [Brachionus plicatilis]